MVVTVLVSVSNGCGGEDEPKPETAKSKPATAGREEPSPAKEQGQIEGLMGTLSQQQINRTLNPKMGQFARCFQKRAADVEMLGGRVEFAFHVAADGTVEWAYPKRSTVGDRETERCLLEVAAGADFPAPKGGGPAEFSWPLEFDPPADVRPAVSWEPNKIEDFLSEKPDAIAECVRPGSNSEFTITAYVAPGGEVLAAGAAVNDRQAVEALDCVTEEVQSWEELPDPGSYPAKVTFEMR